MTYIHERPGWPDFKWDSEALTGPLAAVRHKQGWHLGKMEALGLNFRTEAGLVTLTEEVVKTSASRGRTSIPTRSAHQSPASSGSMSRAFPRPGGKSTASSR